MVDVDIVLSLIYENINIFSVCTCFLGYIDFDLALFSEPYERILPMQSDSFDVPFKVVVKFWPHGIHSFWP